MIFSGDRSVLRRMYADAWEKHLRRLDLSGLERQIVRVIEEHPEYHDDIGSEEITREYRPEDGGGNPFLHMGLHLALRDQVTTNRPAGIRGEFERLTARLGNAHAAEHAMIECLAEAMWRAQRDNQPPDEQEYLERLRRL